MTDSQKLLYGCERETTYLWNIGEYKLKRCPMSSITDKRIYNFIQAYNKYEKGFLPNVGGWLDQSFKFNKVIDIISSELGKIDKAKQKDRERSAKR